MIRSSPKPFEDSPWTVADFEEALLNKPAGERWELVRGQIIRSMTGGTYNHSQVVGNAYALLRRSLDRSDRNCRALMEFGLQVDESLFFPDILVTCDSLRPGDLKARNPVLIVEVLSKATRAYDLGEKQSAYCSLPSLRHYLMLDQSTVGGRLLTRTDGGVWQIAELSGPNDRVHLGTLAIDEPLAGFYEGVDVR